MRDFSYPLGRLVFAMIVIVAMIAIASGISMLSRGDVEIGLCALSVGGIAALVLTRLVPWTTPPEGVPTSPILSHSVQHLARAPSRRSEAVQAYQAETGVTAKEAEEAISQWLRGRSSE